MADGTESKTEKCVLDRGMSFAELMEYFRTLNAAVEAVRKGGDAKDVYSAFPWEQFMWQCACSVQSPEKRKKRCGGFRKI